MNCYDTRVLVLADKGRPPALENAAAGRVLCRRTFRLKRGETEDTETGQKVGQADIREQDVPTASTC